MAYTEQNFEVGQILRAKHMNLIDEEIVRQAAVDDDLQDQIDNLTQSVREELTEYVDEQITELNAIVEAVSEAGVGATVTEVRLTIPTSDWTDYDSTVYPYYQDVACESATEDCLPIINLDMDCETIAYECGLRGAAETSEGYVRFWAVSVPTEDIGCTVYLVDTSSSDTTSSYVLPVATATTLGGVMIADGSGLTVDSSGYLTVDSATADDASELFEETDESDETEDSDSTDETEDDSASDGE